MCFGEFSPNHSEVQNFTLMGYFCPNYIWFELKNTEELSFITVNSETKFEKTLTLWFQKWDEELGKLSLPHSKSEKCTLIGSFCQQQIIVSVRKFQRNFVSWHWRVKQNLKENWLEKWQNHIKNLVNFHASSRKFENLHFDWILSFKGYKDLGETVQKSYVSRHWRVVQILKKNWLLVPKMTWRICWTLLGAVASLKMWYFSQ